jgi:hypothetical protein
VLGARALVRGGTDGFQEGAVGGTTITDAWSLRRGEPVASGAAKKTRGWRYTISTGGGARAAMAAMMRSLARW